MKEIIDYLFSNQDLKYKDFNSSLSPTLSSDSFIGVRTPILRAYAKELLKNNSLMAYDFLKELPHKYFEENQLHAFIISEIKDYNDTLLRVNEFLPYVDNWAICDQLIPKAFKKNKNSLLDNVDIWIKSNHTYTRRFAIKMLMSYFLDDDFKPCYLEQVANASNDEYYIKMMVAWYFATALAKQYEASVVYIEERRLPLWIHRKTITKACESYRVTDKHKTYLKTFR